MSGPSSRRPRGHRGTSTCARTRAAVRVLNGRDPEDPLSFMGQASAYLGRPRGTWFLLPWVRMHLWYFERIVRAIVAETGGPRDWALPFWGYVDARAPGAAALP